MQEMILKIAPPYDEAEVQRIWKEFEKLAGYPVEMTVQEDASLIGGFAVYLDGKVYDASIRTKLASLRRELVESGRDAHA